MWWRSNGEVVGFIAELPAFVVVEDLELELVIRGKSKAETISMGEENPLRRVVRIEKLPAGPTSKTEQSLTAVERVDRSAECVRVGDDRRRDGFRDVLRDVGNCGLTFPDRPDVNDAAVAGDVEPGRFHGGVWQELALDHDVQVRVPASGVGVVGEFEERGSSTATVFPERPSPKSFEASKQTVELRIEGVVVGLERESQKAMRIGTELSGQVLRDDVAACVTARHAEAVVATVEGDTVPIWFDFVLENPSGSTAVREAFETRSWQESMEG